METLELVCPDCGHRETCGPAQRLTRVQAIGMLRRQSNPEPALLDELFQGALPRLACQRCGHVGLTSQPYEEDDWEEDRLCEVCGKRIPLARIEIMPAAKRCVDCA